MKQSYWQLTLVSALVAQLTLGTACGSPGGSSPSDPEGTVDTAKSATTPANYDGQTIFRAVFFNQGAAADGVKEMWADRPALSAGRSVEDVSSLLEHAADEMAGQSYSKESIAMIRSHAEALRSGTATLGHLQSADNLSAVANALVAHIEQRHPEFFPAFREEMQSGDPLRVKATLASAGKTILEAHAELSAISVPVRPINPIPIPSPVPAPIGGDDLVVVDTVAVIYAVAVIAVFAAAVFAITPPDEGGSPVEGDIVIGQLTKAFAL
jgi:SdpC family antimicrobial peptide